MTSEDFQPGRHFRIQNVDFMRVASSLLSCTSKIFLSSSGARRSKGTDCKSVSRLKGMKKININIYIYTLIWWISMSIWTPLSNQTWQRKIWFFDEKTSYYESVDSRCPCVIKHENTKICLTKNNLWIRIA